MKAGDERKREKLLDDILAVNGFNAIKQQALGAASAAGGIPVEAYDAALRYCDQAIDRLRLDLNPAAKIALEKALYDRQVIRATKAFRERLGEIDERQQAREAIVAG